MVKAQKSYSLVTTAHPFTGIHLTEKGLDYLENYAREVREVIGYEVPLAVDHFGHVCVEDCIRFARRMEGYDLADEHGVAVAIHMAESPGTAPGSSACSARRRGGTSPVRPSSWTAAKA